jgi:hypothetical protein
MRTLLLCLVVWFVFAFSAYAQRVDTTEVVIKNPGTPYVTRIWNNNGSGQYLVLGANEYGDRRYYSIGGNASIAWLTDANGFGSAHTLNITGIYDKIVINCKPLTANNLRPFYYVTYINGIGTSHPLIYLPHAKAPYAP